MSLEFEKIKYDINGLKIKLDALLTDLGQRQQSLQPKIEEQGLTKENVECVWDFQKFKLAGLERILAEFRNLHVEQYGQEVSEMTNDIKTVVNESIDQTNKEINDLFDQFTIQQKIETWLLENENEIGSLETTLAHPLALDNEHRVRVKQIEELLDRFRTMKGQFYTEEMWDESKVLLLKAETRLIKALNKAITAHTDFLNKGTT